ncbi:MAG: enoyl-CoA hydratase/isomerase family protein [Coriobacteriaceae bacterium]|nr:enoyl-CoA hydratase/isomerase family protein [Coriobacteriaceae bacterium]
MPYETILTESRDGILIITLNRPQARNAMSSQMMEEFSTELERWENDPTERACIITNTGTCFCAGADLKELAAGTYHLPAGKEDWGLLGMSKHQFKKPLIAAVNGVCVGGGMGLLLACDLAVCSTPRPRFDRRRRDSAPDAAGSPEVRRRTHPRRRFHLGRAGRALGAR